MPNRYFLQLSYKGTHYHGWQAQENTPKTVQQTLDDVLTKILAEKITVAGAGRTDTGVHAQEYFAHFDSEKKDVHIDPQKWLFKLNVLLPEDIAIQKIIPVQSNAHARFDAHSRTYRYFVNRKKDPFLADSAYYLYGKLDLESMNKAAAIVVRNTDFTSFSKVNTQVKNNICAVKKADWEEQGDLLIFTVQADRFLRNMVRSLVGTMLEIGFGKIKAVEMQTIFDAKNRCEAGLSVPAHGLYLTKIDYPEKIWLS